MKYMAVKRARGENSSTFYPVINIFQLVVLLVLILVLKFKVNIGIKISFQFFKFTKTSKFCCCCCCFDLDITMAFHYFQNITLRKIFFFFLAITVAVSGHVFQIHKTPHQLHVKVLKCYFQQFFLAVLQTILCNDIHSFFEKKKKGQF